VFQAPASWYWICVLTVVVSEGASTRKRSTAISPGSSTGAVGPSQVCCSQRPPTFARIFRLYAPCTEAEGSMNHWLSNGWPCSQLVGTMTERSRSGVVALQRKPVGSAMQRHAAPPLTRHTEPEDGAKTSSAP